MKASLSSKLQTQLLSLSSKYSLTVSCPTLLSPPAPQEFIDSPVYPVMVISYEMFVRSVEAIQRVNFDLVVCDEGHRLKNSGIKTTSVSGHGCYTSCQNIGKQDIGFLVLFASCSGS